MRHLQIRDLWLQKEVSEGRIKVFKVRGEDNPADLMTKYLSVKDIVTRLDRMNIGYESQYFQEVLKEKDKSKRIRWADIEDDDFEDEKENDMNMIGSDD